MLAFCDNFAFIQQKQGNFNTNNLQTLYNINQSNGEAPPGPDLLPQAAGRGHRSPVREVRWKVRHLRLVRPPVHPCQDLRRVQLRQLPGQVTEFC